MKFIVDISPAKGESRQIEVDCGPSHTEEIYTTIGIHLRRDDGIDLPLVHVDDFYRRGYYPTTAGELAPASVYLHTYGQRSHDEPVVYHLTELYDKEGA